MAAGRVDVSRRRGYNGYSNKYFDRYRNDVHDVELNQTGEKNGVVYENGHHISSTASNFYFERNGFSCGDAERVLGDLDQSSRLEDGEIPKCDDEIQLPPEKKRKFSPIIWDLESKATLKNRVVPARTSLSPSPSPPADAHAGVAKYAGLELVSNKIHVSGGSVDAIRSEFTYPAITSSKDKYGGHGQKEEEFAELQNISISTSRWASDSDSRRDAMSDNEVIPGDAAYGKESSAYRKEFRREVVGGDSLRSSRSSGRDFCSGSASVNEDSGSKLKKDLMDVDGIHDESDEVKQMDDDCCQVEESIFTTQTGVNMLQSCRVVYEYERLHEISEGTYGKVYKAKDKKTGELVALKKIKMDVGGDRHLEEFGFPLSSLREINILLSLHHPSIVNVKEVVLDGLDNVFMVMEYMEHDLKELMQVMKQPFSTSEVKCLMLQLLEGVKYLHDNWVLHRDLKTLNLLLNNQGELKICDFGMSRQYGRPFKPYTSLVVSLWYRAPELLLGAKQYSTAVDMWSVGCIMAELLSKEPLFKGKGEIDQLAKIFRVLGTPSETIWPGYSNLPGTKANFVKQPYNLLRKKFPAASFTGSPVLSDLGFDLLNKLLTYDPQKRITADASLNHPWFDEVPLPKSKEFMPTFPPQCAKKR